MKCARAGATMKGVKTMPTLRLQVMVKATLSKTPAKFGRGKQEGKESFFNKAKAEGFELKRHRHETKKSVKQKSLVMRILEENIHATREVKLSAEDWNMLKIICEAYTLLSDNLLTQANF